MAHLILHIGTNQGDRAGHLQQARNHLTREFGSLPQSSPIYETAAWGMTDQPPFLNQALGLFTTRSATACLRTVLAIEQSMGRQRTQPWGPRLIDIDLIFYQDLIIRTPELTLPHPWLHQRRFVLVPLADIIPDWPHPVLQLTVRELLESCEDQGEVKVWKAEGGGRKAEGGKRRAEDPPAL